MLKGSRVLQANKFGWSSCQPCRIEDLWRYCTGLFICLIYNLLWKTCLCSNDSSYLNWRVVVKFRLRCYVWNVAIFSIFLSLININNCDFLCWTHWGVYCGPLNLFRWVDGYHCHVIMGLTSYEKGAIHLCNPSVLINSFYYSDYSMWYL